MSLMLIILAGFAVATLWLAPFCIGLRLLSRSLKGVVNDHEPRCSACGYILTGAGPSLSRCSECGANLIGVGTVRYGSRRRPPLRMAVGAAFMSLTIAPTILVVWHAMSPASTVGRATTSVTAAGAPARAPILIAVNSSIDAPASVITPEATAGNPIAAVIRASRRFIDDQTVYARLIAPATRFIEPRADRVSFPREGASSVVSDPVPDQASVGQPPPAVVLALSLHEHLLVPDEDWKSLPMSISHGLPFHRNSSATSIRAGGWQSFESIESGLSAIDLPMTSTRSRMQPQFGWNSPAFAPAPAPGRAEALSPVRSEHAAPVRHSPWKP